MMRGWLQRSAEERRAATLAAIILMQGLCGLFFIVDVGLDVAHGDRLDDAHMLLEAAAAAALCAGVAYLMLELRALLGRIRDLDDGLRAARGEMASIMESFFERWGLTPSERDVALLMLKGVENKEIAEMRGAAAGTVRAQCARVYAKAGVSGRAQLFSLFMEELLAVEPEAQPG